MSGYIGTQPVPQATQTRDAFTCTAGQTSFATSGYTPGFLDVYLNGIKLAAADYTASNGSDVVLASGAALDDILEVVAYTSFEVVTDTVTNAGTVLNLDRTGSDGTILDLKKDGSTVGSIGTSGVDLTIGTGDVGLKFNDASNRIDPWNVTTNTSVDGAFDLGKTDRRFKDLYLSGGVYLGGTGAANKLDDYEEGTWVPTIKGGTSVGTGTYTTQVGFYRKVGQLVFVSAYMVWTGHTGTGPLIFPLPFTPNAGGLQYSSMTIGYANNLNWGSSSGTPNVHIHQTVAEAYLGYSTNNGVWTQSQIDTAGDIIISGCYSAA